MADKKVVDKKVKKYEFNSDNEFLVIAHLGVQFIDGFYATDSREVAERLINYDGVRITKQ